MTAATFAATTSPMPVAPRADRFAPPVENLMDTLHRTGHFKYLMAAVKATGLKSPFNAAGPHTLFAPNDYAFGKLAKSVLAELFEPGNRARLTAVLRLHLVPRRVDQATSDDRPASFKSLQGEDLVLTTADGLKVNKVRVVQRDLRASNGVIYVIDTVLMPTVA